MIFINKKTISKYRKDFFIKITGNRIIYFIIYVISLKQEFDKSNLHFYSNNSQKIYLFTKIIDYCKLYYCQLDIIK
jgi:hypothetical protein